MLKRMIGLAALPLVSCAAAGTSSPSAAAPAPVPGKQARQVVVDGVTREYLVHVPVSADGSRRVPAVFVLHGTSGNGERFYAISGWKEKAEREGFVAVFPTALAYCLGDDEDYDRVVEADEFKVTTKWAAGKLGTPVTPLCTDAQAAQLPPGRQAQIQSRVVRDDVAFFDAMVAAVTADLPVEPKRLYVTGFSNGASMSGRLMVERSDTFAAFAMAAGAPAVPGPARRPAPALFSVGSRDEGWALQAGVAELPVDETLLEIPVMNDRLGTIALDLMLDNTRHSYQPSRPRGVEVATFTYDRSLVGAANQFQVVVIDGVFHQYPNGDNHPLAMAELLWPFFSKYRLP